MKHFPNGFTSWQETHYEVVQAITIELTADKRTGLVAQRHEAQGHGGLYELAEELTDEFEAIHEGHEWDGEFFETIEEWLNEQFKQS